MIQLTKSEKAYFNAAKQISLQSTFTRAHVGCVVVYKHKIISYGCNSTKTHTVQKIYNQVRFCGDTKHTLHAETDAILSVRNLNLCWDKADLYIYRQDKSGHMAMAKPCDSCMKMIQNFGIRKIYYTTVDEYICERVG